MDNTPKENSTDYNIHSDLINSAREILKMIQENGTGEKSVFPELEKSLQDALENFFKTPKDQINNKIQELEQILKSAQIALLQKIKEMREAHAPKIQSIIDN